MGTVSALARWTGIFYTMQKELLMGRPVVLSLGTLILIVIAVAIIF